MHPVAPSATDPSTVRGRLRILPAVLAAGVLALAGCTASEEQSESASSAGASDAAEGSARASVSASASASEEPKELIGGGTTLFPDRRMVALYGTPNGPSLGALGEQSPAESVARVKNLAQQYQTYSAEPVIPAFEVITTTASSAPGEDGDYSDEIPVAQLRPLLEEAEKNDVYVVLDFQPGRSDFPSQVAQYAELLKKPNVGVGIDPEWRLTPEQVPLEQIGSVDAGEINQTLDDVARITREHQLPQKAVVLHQFAGSMITDRQDLDTSHPELALTLHADGHGTPELKKETWSALQEGLPQGIRMSWKNFYDEDTPMLTPQQTYALTPKPWVVTYQ